MTDSITDWLRAQCDADERIARELAGRGGNELPAQLRSAGEQVRDVYGDPDPPEDGVSPADRLWWLARDAADWIAVHGPARVLREIDAKRQTLAELEAAEQTMEQATRDRDTGRYNTARAEWVVLRRVVRRDAAVYADRPGYQEGWRP